MISLKIITTIITIPEVNKAESNVDPNKGTISGKGGLFGSYAQSGRFILNYKKRVPNYLPVTTHAFEKCKRCKKTVHNITCGCKILGSI